MIRRIVDVGLTVLLLFLMAYQVTGEAVHEWVGIAMTVLVIIHQILNRRWYAAFFKGRYNAYRILTAIINIALLASFALTAICGMAMSAHALPFLYGMVKVSVARQLHLSMSHFAFVFMGLHLGMHIPAMIARLKLSDKARMVLSGVMCAIAGSGLFLFLKNGMADYLFFKVPFAFLDYEKAAALVFLENILMLLFFAFVGAQVAVLCKSGQAKDEGKKNKLLPVLFIMAAIIIGLVINMISGKMSSGDGGTFLMGSPESENWRIEDEVQHEVTVSSFNIDPFETTQEEYERLMGKNPSTFSGERFPVETISWLDQNGISR